MLAGKLGYFGGAFFPPSLATMRGWYDFSDNATLTLVSSLISQVTNKSGTAPTLSQGTAANRPGLTTINGVQAASFNGSSTALFSNTAVAATGTLIGVFTAASNGLTQTVVSFSTSSASLTSIGLGSLQGVAAGAGAFFRFTGTGGSASYVASPTSSASITAATYSTPASMAIRVNGTSYTALGAGNFASNQNAASIGAVNINGSYIRPLSGSVGEVLFYSSVLTTSQIQEVERYLSAKWGISV